MGVRSTLRGYPNLLPRPPPLAQDGFVGTYDQVKAHEEAHGLHWDKHGGHDPPPPGSGPVSAAPASALERAYMSRTTTRCAGPRRVVNL